MMIYFMIAALAWCFILTIFVADNDTTIEDLRRQNSILSSDLYKLRREFNDEVDYLNLDRDNINFDIDDIYKQITLLNKKTAKLNGDTKFKVAKPKKKSPNSKTIFLRDGEVELNSAKYRRGGN